MLRFLLGATKVAGLTYQLLATGVMIGALVGGVVSHVRKKSR